MQLRMAFLAKPEHTFRCIKQKWHIMNAVCMCVCKFLKKKLTKNRYKLLENAAENASEGFVYFELHSAYANCCCCIMIYIYTYVYICELLVICATHYFL